MRSPLPPGLALLALLPLLLLAAPAAAAETGHIFNPDVDSPFAMLGVANAVREAPQGHDDAADAADAAAPIDHPPPPPPPPTPTPTPIPTPTPTPVADDVNVTAVASPSRAPNVVNVTHEAALAAAAAATATATATPEVNESPSPSPSPSPSATATPAPTPWWWSGAGGNSTRPEEQALDDEESYRDDCPCEPASLTDPRLCRDCQGVERKLSTAAAKEMYFKAGRWYRSRFATSYFFNGTWWEEAPFNRDPRYRARNKDICLGDAQCQADKWRRLDPMRWNPRWVKAHDPEGNTMWYNGPQRKFIWWYGRWKRTVPHWTHWRQHKKRARELKMERSTDLTSIVERKWKAEVSTFLQWFLTDYLAGKQVHHTDSLHPEQGWQGRFDPVTPTDPEPAEYPNAEVDTLPPSMTVSSFPDSQDPRSSSFDSYSRILADLRSRD